MGDCQSLVARSCFHSPSGKKRFLQRFCIRFSLLFFLLKRHKTGLCFLPTFVASSSGKLSVHKCVHRFGASSDKLALVLRGEKHPQNSDGAIMQFASYRGEGGKILEDEEEKCWFIIKLMRKGIKI